MLRSHARKHVTSCHVHMHMYEHAWIFKHVHSYVYTYMHTCTLKPVHVRLMCSHYHGTLGYEKAIASFIVQTYSSEGLCVWEFSDSFLVYYFSMTCFWRAPRTIDSRSDTRKTSFLQTGEHIYTSDSSGAVAMHMYEHSFVYSYRPTHTHKHIHVLFVYVFALPWDTLLYTPMQRTRQLSRHFQVKW